MPLPIVYRTGGDVQVNYDFADVVSGTGYITFYLQASNLGTGTPSTSYSLTRQTMRSYPVSSQGSTATGGSFTKVLDINFDYPIDKTLTLKGDALCDISSMLDDGANPGNCQFYIVVKIAKYDGSTETVLGSAQGATSTRTGGTNPVYLADSLKIPIPETTLKRGHTLRVIGECWIDASTTGTCNGEIAHSPAAQYWDTNASPVTSQSVIQIPLRLDI